MSILRYRTSFRPFHRFSSLQDEVNRFCDFTFPTRDTGVFSGWTPALDVFDEKDEYVVRVELPGLKKEDLQLGLQDGVLTVSGERKADEQSQSGKTFRSERPVGQFQRSVTLPGLVSGSAVKATYTDGILTVKLPKAEEAKPRTIQVND